MRPAGSWRPGAGPSPSDPVLGARLTAQLLAGRPARDAVAVAERLLAIQAQDPRGARLAVRARTEGLGAADIDRELTERRSLLVTWLNRGTLHLVRAEDYPWLHALTTPPLATANQRRLVQEGVSLADAERGVALIRRTLSEAGPRSREQLRERLQAADIPVAGQALVHLLLSATRQGICVRGPMVGREHAYVLVSDWLPATPPVARDAALAELARRYLAGHGPADERDLARWAGLPLRDARAGLKAIASQLVQRPDGLVDLARRQRDATLPPPRLLGAFEPLLLGWRWREAVLGDNAPAIVTGGMFRNFALAGGRAVAGWRLDGGKVSLEPFAPMGDDVTAALERDGDAVRKFLGLP